MTGARGSRAAGERGGAAEGAAGGARPGGGQAPDILQRGEGGRDRRAE